ncbi:MAG TPA: carboxypeptidase regulatory-like domain-containing protein [Polyangiaceae bacterium]|nr:carboxypeptidase regulatory-like domain-containing protein [Polyangiaceae bacterium]
MKARRFVTSILVLGAVGACSAGSNVTPGGRSGVAAAGSSSIDPGGGAGGPQLNTDGGGALPGLADCPAGQSTTVSGVVYDPAGRVPLYNALVYVPSKPDLDPIASGASCDSCTAPVPALADALSDASGKFVLQDVPAGANVPLVIQVGKWQRKVAIPNVIACQDNPLSDPNLTRLPRTQAEGHIPRIGLSTGHSDALECLLRKIGIADSEFTTDAETGRVNMFRGCIDSDGTAYPASKFAPNLDNGATFPSTSELFTSGEIDNYDMLIFSCEGHKCTELQTDTNIATLEGFENKGGRVFLDHVHYNWINHSNSNIQDAAEFSSGTDPASPLPTQIDMSFPKGQAFAQWLLNVNASTTLGELDIVQAQNSCSSVDPTLAQSWITTTNPVGNFYVTINTPVGKSGMPLDACGRVVFTDLHVSGAVADSSHDDTPFPGGCVSTDITPQEKALEFMLFDLSSCVQKDDVPPQQPPIVK